MSNFVKTYTFVAGSKVLSAQANTNFNEIATFLNSDVVHVDGSKSFTGLPLGPALDPTTGNHLARKQYVDGVLGFSSGTTAQYTTASTVKSALATLTTSALQRLKVSDVTSPPQLGSKPTVASTQFTIQAGTGTVAANTITQAVTFPTAFPNGVVSVVATIGDSTGVTALQVNGYLNTGFTVNGYELKTALDGSQFFGALAGTWRYNWIAIGW